MAKMQLNEYGEITKECWMDIPVHFPHTQLDECIVMANHIRGIICITKHEHKYSITNLIEHFSTENLIRFFRSKTQTFIHTNSPIHTDKADLADGIRVGTFITNGTNEHKLTVYSFKVQKRTPNA